MILPVTIRASKCLLSMCVLSQGLLVTSRHLSPHHILRSTVDGKPSKALSLGKVNSELGFRDHSGWCVGNAFGARGATGALAGVLVRDDIP